MNEQQIVVKYVHHVDAAGVCRRIELVPAQFDDLREAGFSQFQELLHRSAELAHRIRTSYELLGASDEFSRFAAALADLRPYLGVLRLTEKQESFYPSALSLLESLSAADRVDSRPHRRSA